jgi:hypothetical protein
MEPTENKRASTMPKNTIQFQKGLGLHEFLEKYGTDTQCSQALYQPDMSVQSAATQRAVNSRAARYTSATNVTGSTPISRTLQKSLIIGKKECFQVEEKKIQHRV